MSETVRSEDAAGASRVRPSPVSLVRSLLYFFPSYAVAIVGYLGLTVIAARMLGPADFGYLIVLLTAAGFVGQFSLMGVHRAGLREAARAEDVKTLTHLHRGVRAVMLVPLPAASVIAGVLVWLIYPGSSSAIVTAVLSGALVYASGFQMLSANFLRGLGHLRIASLLSGRSGGSLVAVLQVACVGLVAWVAPESGVPGVLLGVVAGYLGPLLFAWWVLSRSWPRLERPHHTMRDLGAVVTRDWRFTFSQSGGYLNSTVELWLAGAVLTAGGTSLFAASQRLARLLVIPASSLSTVFSPAISRLSSAGDRAQLQTLIRTAASVSAVVTALVWLPMVAAPEHVLRLVFGPGFEDAAPALALLATAYLLNSVSGMSGTALSMSHHEGRLAMITWAVVATRVASGVVCALLWGITGLAASALAISALYYSATWLAVRRRLSISTHATLRPKLSILARIAG